MATLPRFTLKHNKQNDRWDLKNRRLITALRKRLRARSHPDQAQQ